MTINQFAIVSVNVFFKMFSKIKLAKSPLGYLLYKHGQRHMTKPYAKYERKTTSFNLKTKRRKRFSKARKRS